MKVSLIDQMRFLQAMSCDPKLSGAARAVAVLLVDRYSHSKGYAWPSYRWLSHMAAIDKRTVGKASADLRERGWFTIEGKGGGRNSLRYYPQWRRGAEYQDRAGAYKADGEDTEEGDEPTKESGPNVPPSTPQAPERVAQTFHPDSTEGGPNMHGGWPDPAERVAQTCTEGGPNRPPNVLNSVPSSVPSLARSGSNDPGASAPPSNAVDFVKSWVRFGLKFGTYPQSRDPVKATLQVTQAANYYRPKIDHLLSQIGGLEGWDQVLNALDLSEPLHGGYGFAPSLEFMIDVATCKAIEQGAFRMRSADNLIDQLGELLANRADRAELDLVACMTNPGMKQKAMQDLLADETNHRQADILIAGLIALHQPPEDEPLAIFGEALPPAPQHRGRKQKAGLRELLEWARQPGKELPK